MAKLSKKTLQELDEAIDQLGGGVAPIPPPTRPRQAAKARKSAKPKRRSKKR